MNSKNDGFHKVADFMSDYWPEMLNTLPPILLAIWGGLLSQLPLTFKFVLPGLAIIIMIICYIFIFRKNKSIVECESKIEDHGRKIQEQELSLEKFGQENAALFNPVRLRVEGARKGGFWDLVLLQFILNGSTNRVENVFIKS